MQVDPASIDQLINQLKASAGGGLPPPPTPPLNPRDGGGTSEGMEARIAKLEAHMEHVRGDLSKLQDVPTSLATLTERVGHLPTKGFIITATVAALALVAAVSSFVQWALSLH